MTQFDGALPLPRSGWRRLFFLLLLANGVGLGLGQLRGGGGGEPASAHAPVNAEIVQLLPPGELARAQPLAEICLEWGPFSGERLAQASAAVMPLAGDNAVARRPVEAGRGWWVYMPPQKTRADAERKLGELKMLGVADFQLMADDGKWRHAISLGVFSSEEAAAKRLEQLRNQGVRSAVMEARGEAGATWLVLRGLNAEAEAKLVELKLGYPDSELKAVPCPRG